MCPIVWWINEIRSNKLGSNHYEILPATIWGGVCVGTGPAFDADGAICRTSSLGDATRLSFPNITSRDNGWKESVHCLRHGQPRLVFWHCGPKGFGFIPRPRLATRPKTSELGIVIGGMHLVVGIPV